LIFAMNAPVLTSASSAQSRASSRGVVVYTTNYCGYCVRAERLLQDKGIAFEKVNVDGDWEARDWLVEYTGQRTVPQILVHGRPIGGFTELAALSRSGRLDELLRDAPAP
jgi:glutaredoxin 3